MPYAEARPEIAAMSAGERVLAFYRTDSWSKVMLPVLNEIEAKRRAPRPGEKGRRGWASPYTAHEFESLEILRRVLGRKSTQATRDWLASDRGRETRELLGFDRPRARHGGRAQQLMHGIPCDSVLSNYRCKWFPEDAHNLLWNELEKALRDESLLAIGSAAADAECALLTSDGSKLETHFTPPKYTKRKKGSKKARVCFNRKKVTCPEAGYIPLKAGNADHSGSGWNLVFTASAHGRPLAWELKRINEPENEALVDQLDEVGKVVNGLGAEPRLRVLSTDGAFHSQELRRRAHEHGLVENVHLASHGGGSSSKRNANKRNRHRIDIEGYPNWQANGHRELICKCGAGNAYRRVTLGDDGRAVVRTEGGCATCGTISITAGKWRYAKDPNEFRRCQKGEEHEADWVFGNPLTFNDPVAREYGRHRWATHEGMNGSQLTQRFGLLRSKRWFRRKSQAELEVAMVFSILHVLAIEGEKRRPKAQPQSGPPNADAPPGETLPLAA